jgi:large subunit ribosomal protein L29
MKAFEIRNLSDSELQTKLEEAHEEFFNLRFQASIGQMRDVNQLKLLKKDIARLKTVLRERQLAAAA